MKLQAIIECMFVYISIIVVIKNAKILWKKEEKNWEGRKEGRNMKMRLNTSTIK